MSTLSIKSAHRIIGSLVQWYRCAIGRCVWKTQTWKKASEVRLENWKKSERGVWKTPETVSFSLLMPPTRLGSLDHPERFDGARSVSVYEGADGGLFIKIDGLREKLHGSTRWTTTSGVQMRGRSVYTEAPRSARARPAWEGSDDQYDEEQRQIELAIERSLQPDFGEPAAAGHEAAALGNVAPVPGSHNCVICLEENAACMLCVPCNHMVSCQACSRRLQGSSCPMCRRQVTRVIRVYF